MISDNIQMTLMIKKIEKIIKKLKQVAQSWEHLPYTIGGKFGISKYGL